MKKNQFEILPIPSLPSSKQEDLLPKTIVAKQDAKDPLRIVTTVNHDLAEKLKNYVYWERTTQHNVLTEALEEFLKNKEIKSRPESERAKKKAGRKIKTN